MSVITGQNSDFVLFANLTRLEDVVDNISLLKLTAINDDDMRLQLAPVSNSALVGSLGFLISCTNNLKRSKPSF